MREELEEALLRQQPQMKPMLAARCVRNYIRAVVTEIAGQFAMMSSEDFATGEVNFGAERVMKFAGQVMLGEKQVRVWSLMQQHPSTRLIHIVYRGNSLSKRVSRGILSPKYRRSIMEELKSLAIELNPMHLDEQEERANWDLIVDPDSLDSYIEQTRRCLAAGGHGEQYEAKLFRNLTIANTLKGRVRATPDGSYYVSEYWEQIDSGRMYGHGLSLQRIPKEVRHAMLGYCHKYDFKASSYALLASLAIQIDPTLKSGALKDYIQHRTIIRKRIAMAVGISEDWAKSILTSLGFGAELRDNPHNAIRRKLGQEKYHALICNEEFGFIAAQLKAVSKVIDAEFPSAGFEFLGREYSPIDAHGCRRTKSQKLAWIYQCMESEALRAFLDLAGEVPLLVAHDCVYYKQKLSAPATVDITYQLSQKFALLRFEHEDVIPIHATEQHGLRKLEIEAEVARHGAFIEQQAHLAREYVPVFCGISAATISTRNVETPWGPIEADAWQHFRTTGLPARTGCVIARFEAASLASTQLAPYSK